MKSAYELAMEKFGGDAPSSLTDEQKEEIAKIDQKFTAKIAERELFLDGLIAKAQEAGNFQELPELETQKRSEIARLKGQCESAKEEVRNG